MKKQNQWLAIAAAILFLLSAWTYYDSVQRAQRFERGQHFLPNLNPDEIARIEIEKGDSETILKRSADDDRFVMPSSDGYYAKNASVNRFIQDVLELALEKKVGKGESLEKELDLTVGEERPEETIEVALVNSAGKDMVRFLVGKAFEGGGNYVRRVDADPTIYLTDKRVYLSTEESDFLETQILDLPREEIKSISGADFAFTRGGEAPEEVKAEGEAESGEEAAVPVAAEKVALELVDLPAGKKESAQAAQVKGVLQGLRFTKHLLADAPEAQGLVFDRQLEVQLEDGSGYVLESAEKDGKHYLRISGFHTAGRITIAQDASDEEVKATSGVLERADELQKFNAFHGSWVYEVTENTADRIRATRSDLVADA